MQLGNLATFEQFLMIFVAKAKKETLKIPFINTLRLIAYHLDSSFTHCTQRDSLKRDGAHACVSLNFPLPIPRNFQPLQPADAVTCFGVFSEQQKTECGTIVSLGSISPSSSGRGLVMDWIKGSFLYVGAPPEFMGKVLFMAIGQNVWESANHGPFSL